MTTRLTMTLPEFALAAGISRNQAYALAREGRLGVPVLSLGRRLVVPRAAVLRFLNGESNENG